MAFDWTNALPGVLLLILTGWLGAFVAGMLGVGGAIVLFPLLLAGPARFGLDPLPPATISGVVLVQVALAMSLATWQHGRSGRIDWSLVRPLGIAAAAGAILGGFVSGRAPEAVILWTFAGLASCSALAIAWPVKPGPPVDAGVTPPPRRDPFTPAIAAVIGLFSGVSGLGGAILLVPVLRWTRRLEPHQLVVTTPPIVAVTALSGLVGKLVGGPLAWDVAVCLALGTLHGAPLGARTGQRLSPGILRLLLTAAIAASALQVAWRAAHAP